ncbi:MAG: glycosyltransferase family 2 protein [Proteobacteria bacterium]|nr:glycosyltransferase family 2 protein [Pseudomonadota bacterium]
MASPAPTLSLVVPVYNEAAGLDAFVARTRAVLDGLGLPWEIVFVDDGSRDVSVVTLLAARERDARLKVVELSRNFGKEVALAAGLDHADGEAVIPIDADLQHPPELIPELVAAWRAGSDMVIAVRRNARQEGWARRSASRLFDRLFRRVASVDLPVGAGDFRLLSAPVVRALRKLPERARFMKGLYAWVGFRYTTVPYAVEPRAGGTSGHDGGRLWRLALDGITAFSAVPLKAASVIGFLIALVALLYGAYLVVKTLVLGIDVPGYASTITLVLFLGGLQLIGLGVLGEYVARIYDEVKGRPLYVVRARHGVDGSDAP